MASKRFKALPLSELFHVDIINKNTYGFFIQSGINLYLWVFQKAKLSFAEAASTIQLFEKPNRVN